MGPIAIPRLQLPKARSSAIPKNSLVKGKVNPQISPKKIIRYTKIPITSCKHQYTNSAICNVSLKLSSLRNITKVCRSSNF